MFLTYSIRLTFPNLLKYHPKSRVSIDSQTVENAEKQPPPVDRDSSVPLAGLFLILTAIATLIAVVTRVSANADQPTLAETLSAIADNRILYGAGGAARLVSGVTLLVVGVLLMRSWLTRQGYESRLGSSFFAMSGVFTAVSGACALALSVSAQENPTPESIGSPTETVDLIRGLFGEIGFTFAGLALVIAAARQWQAGLPFSKIAPLSALIGIAMLFIWWDAATIIHRITGVAFLLWLVLIGFMLVTGRVERHFILKSTSRSSP